ncbi:sensor histidine kinase [Halobacillus litoralis]|uniref:sensor histidine kinase n=1 Tax=Halobacillus litoralis TaxID=45668 RepID=UPI001CD4B3C5|nr:sensor histidine kinase [Halobacillus litoralis]MCA0970570.1 sensor histidine kinase [Halobacillus litoralis]
MKNLNIIRLAMFYLITSVYYLNFPDTNLHMAVVIVAIIGFTVTHFLLYGPRGEEWLAYILAVNFTLIFILGMLDPGSTVYLILFGVDAVTLFTVENRRKVILPFVLLFGAMFITINLYSYQVTDSFSIFENLISGAFVVFSVIVGRLIYRLMEAQETVSEQYGELKDAHDQLKQYSEQVEELTAIEERNRISREIHDTVGHKMTALLMQLQVARELQQADPDKSASALQVSEDLAREALHETRMSVRTLQSTREDARSFVTKVRELLEDYERQTGLESMFHVEGEPTNLPPTIQLTMTRLVQESLTNAVKHGHAKTCEVELITEEERVTLHITDDGKGAGDVQFGFGMTNMRERVQEYGGRLTFETQPDKGFSLRAVFPLRRMTWKVGGGHDNPYDRR